MDVTWKTKRIPATPQKGEILRVEGTCMGVTKYCGWLLSKHSQTIEELIEMSKRAIITYFQSMDVNEIRYWVEHDLNAETNGIITILYGQSGKRVLYQAWPQYIVGEVDLIKRAKTRIAAKLATGA